MLVLALALRRNENFTRNSKRREEFYSFMSYSSNLLMLTQHLSNKFLLQHQDCGEQRQDLRPQPPAQLPAQHPRVRPQALRGNNDNEDNDDVYDMIDHDVSLSRCFSAPPLPKSPGSTPTSRVKCLR